ncbi:hypothetical protein FB567DRAFT_260032 [Paraphoma chrysanthemicola]|uniref:Uncharacterized protein n=1 Tax=Paraphoma chrysanthemicola TaxID=798071 RepID=A0A8K0QRD9_9PLEO|nr:hypothetical protein FB567DRAFT_260032 [Paraphoma chrysanthemicola]
MLTRCKTRCATMTLPGPSRDAAPPVITAPFTSEIGNIEPEFRLDDYAAGQASRCLSRLSRRAFWPSSPSTSGHRPDPPTISWYWPGGPRQGLLQIAANLDAHFPTPVDSFIGNASEVIENARTWARIEFSENSIIELFDNISNAEVMAVNAAIEAWLQIHLDHRLIPLPWAYNVLAPGSPLCPDCLSALAGSNPGCAISTILDWRDNVSISFSA